MAASPAQLRMPNALRALVALLLVGLAVSLVQGLTSRFDPVLNGVVGEIVYDATLFGSALLCVARAALYRPERAAWAVMGLALLLYTCGNVYWSVVYSNADVTPLPSVADAFWILFFPAAYVAVVLLTRARMPHVDPRLWLDGLIALLTACAVSAAVVVDALAQSTGGDLAAVVTGLAYPIGDMVLGGLVVGVMAAGRGRLDRSWVCLLLGVLAFVVADSVYAYQGAQGTYVEWGLLDALWPLATILIGLSAWQPAGRMRRADNVVGVVVPAISGLVALALLFIDHFARISLAAVLFATAAIAAGVVRFFLTHRQSRANLRAVRVQAASDTLTGLGNRFALLRDLDLLAERDGDVEPHALLLFDLDGFKNYNDAYGHPAGDALLTRLGARLAAAAEGHGTAYRMGGDEFCILASCTAGDGPGALIARAREALTERGDGFAVGASCGHALLPEEAGDAAEALRVADRRLYAEKNSGRVSALMQSAGVLRRALDEWDSELGSHGHDVAVMAASVARRLGLEHDEVERVAAAAELHDVGKIAVPRSILHKRGKLNQEEWEFMRRHTVIGERIVQAAPALAGVGRLIRSSHERWDGAGYPDGLAGEQIPLGSQIVFICDAFSAMTTDRSYRVGMPEENALEELRRHAGTQFAPAVVDAFVAAWTASRAVAAAA